MSVNSIQIEMVRKLIRHGATDRVVRILNKFRPAELADFFAYLSPAEEKKFVEILFDIEEAASTISELPTGVLTDLLARLPDELIANILTRMPSDDAAMTVGLLDEERVEQVLDWVDGTRRERIEHIRNYPPQSAGSLMTSELLTLSEGMTAQEAIESIRGRAWTSEFIFYVYVINENGTFVGVVPLRRLITADPEQRLIDVMVVDPIAVNASEDQEKVAEITARYNLLAVPVVDEAFKLLGVITVDDVIDVLQDEATEDMYLMQGLSDDDRVYAPMSVSIKKRFPWMVLNLGMVFMTASVVGLFERSIAELVILATFMPVVANMGGNGGTQTLTVVTRGIALGELTFSDARAAILKQIGVGMVVGSGIGLLTALAAWAWKGNPWLGVVLFCAMVINMTVAGFMGAAVPLFLKSINQDPALGGGVIVTTFTDVFGFLAFLGLATLLLPYLV